MNNIPDEKKLCTVMASVFSRKKEHLHRQELIAAFSRQGLLGTAYVFGDALFFKRVQEAFTLGNSVYLFYRPYASKQQYLELDLKSKSAAEITVEQYLDCKDRCALKHPTPMKPFRINFSFSGSETLQVRDWRHIGNGLSFLLSHLCTSLTSEKHMWIRFFEQLKAYEIEGRSVLLNRNSPRTVNGMLKALGKVQYFLKTKHETTPWCESFVQLKKLGFDLGWGDNLRQVLKNLSLFENVLENPNPPLLTEFLSQLPLISKVAILSPHGWFGQKNVLGKPDTGGQVIYILDQVRGLEKTLNEQMKASGLNIGAKIIVLTRLIPNAGNTSCNQRLEKINGTTNSWILRIPFRSENGDVVDDWTSRFHVWPYLDRYTQDLYKELSWELQGKPDMIIGNYSDGNIVASLLAEHFDATLCTISHALEKTKYLRSDLMWEELEDDYHFSIHFMSDLLAMQRSDFIMTSTYQEIAGTDEAMGQYESYGTFTLPNCYQVVSGSNICNPKYNVNPPGVDERNYFPYHMHDRRDGRYTELLKNKIFMKSSNETYGQFDTPEKPLLFAMSRLDRIKNLSGFVEAYGMSDELQKLANIIIAGGTTNLEKSKDTEEKSEILRIYQLVEEYNLDGKLRWLPSVEKLETGEIYRIIADSRGVFVQPALFEGFGLTVLEAMVSGLPTFATMYGGPSEIIEDGVSGFLIDPHDAESLAKTIARFLHQAAVEPAAWKKVSNAGIERVLEHFTWSQHCKKLATMANAFGFWRITLSNSYLDERIRYWEPLYNCFIKKRSEEILH